MDCAPAVQAVVGHTAGYRNRDWTAVAGCSIVLAVHSLVDSQVGLRSLAGWAAGFVIRGNRSGRCSR